MKLINIPMEASISTVICIKNVQFIRAGDTTEFFIDAFTWDIFGEIIPVDILQAASDTIEIMTILQILQNGALLSITDAKFRIEDNCICLLFPDLRPWDPSLEQTKEPVGQESIFSINRKSLLGRSNE